MDLDFFRALVACIPRCCSSTGGRLSNAAAKSGRIRLLKLVTNFGIGGTERQVANLVTRLDSTRFELHMASLHKCGDLLKDIEKLAVPCPEFDIGKLYTGQTLQQAFRFSRYIRANSIQIVHSYGFYANVFAIPAAKMAGKCITVASIRDMGQLLTPAKRNLPKTICPVGHFALGDAE